jgi:hypothetical protein
MKFCCACSTLGNVVALPACCQRRAACCLAVRAGAGCRHAKGTLSADWIAFKNNTYSILCLRDECIVADVEQIGPKQINSIDGPLVYSVKQWTDDGQVVAEDDAFCSRITITLDRKTETVLWVETPINQTTIACKNADNTMRKATLETSLYWQKWK